MFGKKVFIGLLLFGGSLDSYHIKCVSLNKRPCQARPALVDVNSNEPVYCPFTARWICNTGGGRCNTTEDQYAQICITNKVKNMNVENILFIAEGK